jgi:hypothetical protein
MGTDRERRRCVVVAQRSVVDCRGVAAGRSTRCQQHRAGFQQVTSDVDKQVQTTAAVSAVVMGQQAANLELLVQSYANRPSLVTGVAAGAHGGPSVELNLESLAHAVPGISATFVASTEGTSLATCPRLSPSPTAEQRSLVAV